MTRERNSLHIKLARQVGGAIAGLLALALLLGLTACGGGQAKEPEVQPPAVAEDNPPDVPEANVPAPPENSAISDRPEPVNQILPEEEHDGFPDPEEDEEDAPGADLSYTQEEYDQLVSDVLAAIIRDSMTPLEQARAVFDYVHANIRYTGHSDKSDWQNGAYVGLSTGKGDCFTYYAVSRALLTALDIDNLEVQRVGGRTLHFWNLVNCGDGWYHFDACPRSMKMPAFTSFMVTDEQIAAFTAMAGRNYYDFDGSLLPERATEIVTNTRPIPRPPQPEEEEDPDAQDPEADPDEPMLPPDDPEQSEGWVDPETGVNEGETPSEETPAEVWTEPPVEAWPEPEPAGEPEQEENNVPPPEGEDGQEAG